MSDSRVPAKRAACDRCRTQKLRCIRLPNHPADACNRCVRSHMECVSSSSKRPGRPRNLTNTSRQSGESTPSSSSVSSAVESNSSIATVDMQTLENVDWFNLDLLDSSYDISSAPWATMEAMFPGEDSNITDASLQTQNITCNDASLNEIFTETTQNESFSLQSEQNDNVFPQNVRRCSATLDLDPGVQLAVLQRELSVQVFSLKSMPWDIAKALKITSMADSDPSNHCHDADYNPLAKIAKTTEDFAKFLRSLQDSLGKKDSEEIADGPMSLLQSSLSITDLLTVLSCHMLTLSIYESIFSHFIDQAQQKPSLVNDLLQSTPQLFVGGIAVPPRLDMLGHLLYCLAGSLLQPIEILLGLPDDFCVSLQRDRVGDAKACGLFSGQSGKQLFSTLLKIEEERMKGGVIASLKEKIRRVQGLA